MKSKVTTILHAPLLEKEYTINCYIEVEKAIIVNTEIDEDDLALFKEEFYSKYLLEYGDLKIAFIDEEYDKFLNKIHAFIDSEVDKEKKRIAKLLEKLEPQTINFLKKADSLNPKRR